jgi:hypothetical protein
MAEPFHHKHPYLTVLILLIILLVVTESITDWLGYRHYHGRDGSSYHGQHDDGHGRDWRDWARHHFDGDHKKGKIRGGECQEGMDRWAESLLFLGRGSETGNVVSDADWQQFRDSEIRTRFPDGFTVLDADGHWGAGSGASYSEQTKILLLLHDGSEYDIVDEIGDAYIEKFGQESAIRVDSFVCLKFMG